MLLELLCCLHIHIALVRKTAFYVCMRFKIESTIVQLGYKRMAINNTKQVQRSTKAFYLTLNQKLLLSTVSWECVAAFTPSYLTVAKPALCVNIY